MKELIIKVITLSIIGTVVVIASLQIFLLINPEIDKQCVNIPKESFSIDTPETNPELLLLWEKERPLEWSDFKGEPVKGDLINACTYTWIRPTFTIVWVDDPSEPYFYLKNFRTEAYFVIYDSWVMPRVLEENIETQERRLKHEQGHFDLAEEHAQKFTQTLNAQLLGKEFPTNGTTTSERYSNDQKTAWQMVSNITEILYDEWSKDSLAYDKEVDVYWKVQIQNEYNKRFDKLRNEP